MDTFFDENNPPKDLQIHMPLESLHEEISITDISYTFKGPPKINILPILRAQARLSNHFKCQAVCLMPGEESVSFKAMYTVKYIVLKLNKLLKHDNEHWVAKLRETPCELAAIDYRLESVDMDIILRHKFERHTEDFLLAYRELVQDMGLGLWLQALL